MLDFLREEMEASDLNRVTFGVLTGDSYSLRLSWMWFLLNIVIIDITITAFIAP